MANNSLNASINLVNLDFDTLKASFKTYLKNQATFADYDFEGSNLSLLLDLLAYNTYKNAFYLNMALSEGFLDSAQLRNSLMSHAKELNYLPRSVRSAKANVNVVFEASGESQPYVIPKGSPFSTLIKSQSYVFTTPETIVVSSANNTFEFDSEIYEGVYQKDAYVFLDNVENQRFKITNVNVDTRSIAVTVYEDGSQIGDVYLLTSTLLDLNENSKLFFLQTAETGHYEIYFGDNNLGRQPKLNSTIVIDYRVSNGPLGNGARSFSVDFDPTGANELLSTPLLTVGDVANNGAEAETNESIRYYAPRHFQVQERTITTNDYEIALKTEFPEINAVSVYGGEDTEPPQFGKVFISVDISDVDGLPESKKNEYYAFVKRRSPLSIDPIIIEPEYLYLSIHTSVRYNINITTNSLQRIRTIVTDTISTYNNENLNDFNSTLRQSKLTSAIDDSDISILSNITEVHMYKKLNPTLDLPQNIDINFNIPLVNNIPNQGSSHPTDDARTVFSSSFIYAGENCILEDDGNGILRIIRRDGNNDVTVVNIGTVDYNLGAIQLANFNISFYEGAALKLYAIPRDKDITSTKNTILQIEAPEIHVTPEALRI